MNEGAKTAIFAGIAVLMGCLWLVARPTTEGLQIDDLVGEPLFPEFTDANEATGLEIVRYDGDVGEIHTFEVSKNAQSSAWSIPSHAGYPADAEDQMLDAATSLVGLKVLGLVTQDASEHKKFGVMEPDKEQTKLGDEGVGLLVRFEGSSGELASLIIGEPIKGSDGHRFVRRPGQDMVFDVSVDPEKLSTKFEDWIETDLLDVNTIDAERLRVRDYSALRTLQGISIQRRFDLASSYNSTDAKWELAEFLTYDPDNPLAEASPAELLETEELNKEKLDDLKNSLDDVKIVDVRRKPEGMQADLKAGADFLQDEEAVQSLVARGFYPLKLGEEVEIFAANGEVHALMKDGYEYVLRFGNVAGTDESGDAEDSDEGDSGTALTRFMMVTARVDESKFPVPDLEPLPPKPGDSDPPPAPSEDGDDTPPADKPDSPDAEPKDDAPAAPTETEAKPAESDATPAEGTDDEPIEGSDAEETEPASECQDEAADAEQTETDTASEAADDSADDVEKAEEKPKSEYELEVERITKANDRKMEEWRENKTKAEDKVRELNNRFADWYYVISEDVYRKMRLNRSDLIVENEEAAKEGFGVDAFRKLQEEGLKKAEPTP